MLADEPWRRLASRLALDPARRYAQIRNIHVASESWTVEAGLLTPTLKVRRFAVASRYARAIADLYGPHAVFD